MMLEFDPYSREYNDDPYALYERLREEAPIYYNERMKFWALSRYADVVEAHKDAKTYSSAGGTTLEGHEAAMPLLIVKDQPEHGWAKALVAKLFSRQRMEALDIFIRQRATELLDGIWERHGATGEFDLVAEYSVRLPLDVISELLGIPEENRADVHHYSNLVVQRGESRDEAASAQASMNLIGLYMKLATERRANPRDDIISTIIAERTTDEDGNIHEMSDQEIAVRFMEMGFAGHETVAKAIPNGAMAFTAHPDQWAMLRDDPSLVPQAVEEILRHQPPSQLQGRTTTRDVQLHGRTIPAGERVMLITGSAVRDPRAFDRPDEFDITRKTDQRSIYFGFGVHKCLGIHLARRELAITFEELARRFPDFSVDASRATRAILSNVRGVASLPAVLGKPAG